MSTSNKIIQPKQPRRGKSTKGQKTAFAVLLAAEQLLINQGYNNFSLRKVAEAANLTLGNLQYYYPSKDLLIKAMLDHIIGPYLQRIGELREEAGPDPEDQFRAVITHVITDLNLKETTMFFPEIWSLANHHNHAVEIMDAMYGQYRALLIDIMAEINPDLSQAQLQRLGLFVSASIEGHTIFIGYKKPWIDETTNITDMAITSFLWLIRSGQIPE